MTNINYALTVINTLLAKPDNGSDLNKGYKMALNHCAEVINTFCKEELEASHATSKR